MAFMADVHGHLTALEAVLADCKSLGVERFFVGGDLVYGGNEPLEVWKRLSEIGAVCTRGTSDVALVAVDPDKLRPTDVRERASVERFRHTQKALGELILARIRKLPDLLHVEIDGGGSIALSYGSPLDPTLPITHDLDDDEVDALIADDPSNLVISGGADVPFVRDVGGIRVVGLGSVGEAPSVPRVAHFALVLPTPDGLLIEPRWVAY